MGVWVRVAKVDDLAPGQGKTVEAKRTAIALFNVAGTFYAIGNDCRHRGGPLAEGALHGTVVTCPWHDWRFDVTTGATVRNPEIGVPRYNVEVRGDDVFIEMPER
jgi:nitrite reductase/ring-hydroxylating ferredoxin subunit